MSLMRPGAQPSGSFVDHHWALALGRGSPSELMGFSPAGMGGGDGEKEGDLVDGAP